MGPRVMGMRTGSRGMVGEMVFRVGTVMEPMSVVALPFAGAHS